MSLRDILRESLFEPGATNELRRRLRSGAPCVVRDAFRSDFARSVHEALRSAAGWEPRKNVQPFGGFRNQMIEGERLAGELQVVQQIFSAEQSRALVAEWTGMACDELVDFNASLYRPGDYSLPHNDAGQGRTVSFICHFSDAWEPSWGGHFCWCAPTATVSPTFNSLVLFRVTEQSYHFVSPVRPEASGDRLTLHCWFRGREHPEPPLPKRNGWARGPLEEIGAGLFAVGSSADREDTRSD